MATSILPGLLEGYEIRMSGDDENPFFCLIDLCSALGIKDDADLWSKLDPDGFIPVMGYSKGGKMIPLAFINESNIYRLICLSRRPNAKKFQKWLFEKVVLSIRKTGSYSMKPDDID